MINELREKALANKERIDNDPASSEEDKKIANDTVEFLRFEDNIDKVAKSTIFAMFNYLGYSFEEDEIINYNKMYHNLIEEINKKYTLIDDGALTR